MSSEEGFLLQGPFRATMGRDPRFVVVLNDWQGSVENSAILHARYRPNPPMGQERAQHLRTSAFDSDCQHSTRCPQQHFCPFHPSKTTAIILYPQASITNRHTENLSTNKLSPNANQ